MPLDWPPSPRPPLPWRLQRTATGEMYHPPPPRPALRPRIVWCRVSERLGLFVAHAFFPSGGNGGRGCVGRGRGQPFIIHRPFRALPSFSVVRIKYKARIPAARENSSMILASSQRSGVVDFSIFGRRLDVIDRCDLPRLCSALLRNQTSPPLAPPLPDDIALGLT